MITVQLPLRTTPARAVAFAAGILATQGFRIEPSDTGVAAVGPSLNSTKESPLRGAGAVSLVIADGTIEGRADLAGTRRLVWFVVAFPPALIALQFLVFFATTPASAKLAGAMGTMLVLWLIIGPLMAWWIRSRSEAAFRTFVANVAVAP